MGKVETWDPRRLNRFLDDLERRQFQRELTFEEEKLCNETYFFSSVGFRKTKRLMMDTLMKHWHRSVPTA